MEEVNRGQGEWEKEKEAPLAYILFSVAGHMSPPHTHGALPHGTVGKERAAGVLQNSTHMCATSPKRQPKAALWGGHARGPSWGFTLASIWWLGWT